MENSLQHPRIHSLMIKMWVDYWFKTWGIPAEGLTDEQKLQIMREATKYEDDDEIINED